MNIMDTRFSKLMLALGLGLTVGIAQAAPITFDFGAVGVNNEGANPGEADGTPVGLRFDGSNAVFTDGFSGSGLQVIATGQDISGSSNNPFAYLDSTFNGRQAGLGVCQNLSGDDCSPNADDNVTGNDNIIEQLTLTFNQEVELSDLMFKGQNHFAVDENSDTGSPELDGTDTFLLNGNEISFADAEAGLLSLTGTDFTFAFGGNMPEQFYIGTLTANAGNPNVDVPAPAGLGLLAFGLLGLGALVRRRRSM